MEELTTVARIKSVFPSKFGIPRQSNLVKSLRASIVFEKPYRNPDMLRGLEGFSHIWLIWGFSGTGKWSPTVRPPRLGGNVRMGVFATRSPCRPSAIGLSAVKIERIDYSSPLGPIIHILGADLLDNTAIYDIKPYVPYSDCLPEASPGFATPPKRLSVKYTDELASILPHDLTETLTEVLSLDPRPSYHDDAGRVYGMEFSEYEVKFKVENDVLTVVDITKRAQG